VVAVSQPEYLLHIVGASWQNNEFSPASRHKKWGKGIPGKGFHYCWVILNIIGTKDINQLLIYLVMFFIPEWH
jgi:hypothetical protein